jgi:hypothetical protein
MNVYPYTFGPGMYGVLTMHISMITRVAPHFLLTSAGYAGAAVILAVTHFHVAIIG